MAADPVGWIFPSLRSESGHIEQMASCFARCARQAGLDPKVVIPHIMRHTAITRLADTGAGIKTLQEFSGHKSITMILRYAHPQERSVNAALDRMEKSGTPVEHFGVRSGSIS
jgi:site-specific recombinase XerD